MANPPSTIEAISRDYRSCWKELLLTNVVYRIIALILLTPLVGVLFGVLMFASGKTILADQDILFFFLGPVGWISFILVGAIWLGIQALEQAALLGIISAARGQQRMGVVQALRFASVCAWPVVRVAARLAGLTLLTIAPFLAIVGLIYGALLTEFDINYYLKEKPPVFVTAVVLGAIIAMALVAVLLRLFTGWFFALPLVLFEHVDTSAALRTSRQRADGHRRTLLFWIVVWIVATIFLSAIASSLVIWLARFFVPQTTSSLHLLLFAIGAVLVLLSLVNLAVNLISTTTFSALLFELYRRLGSKGDLEPIEAPTTLAGAGFKLTRGKLFATSVAGTILCAIVGISIMRNVRLEDKTDVTAHRGASAATPENTMAAVKQAIVDGADWVEIDVQETADGEVVVFHDSDFMKLAGNNLKIWDATMADLKDIDIGSWFAPEFASERVPTLADVLTECKGKVGVNIELKYYGHDKQLEQRVAEIVEEHGMESEIVVMSLKSDAAKKMKSMRPTWKVGLLMSVFAGDLNSLEVDFLAVNAGFVDRPFIRSAQHNGKEVYVWTVNDAATMSSMISQGVDSLITDKPALARSVLAQRAELSAPERLLLEFSAFLGLSPELGEP